MREVNNNMYSVSAYFFGKVISEIPSSILTPVIFGAIVYFAIGLSTVHAYTFPLFCNLFDLMLQWVFWFYYIVLLVVIH